MNTTDTLLATVAKTVVTGKAYIKSVKIQAAAPVTVSFYDSAGNAVTWARPTYTRRTVTGAQSGSVSQQDCCGSPAVTINTTGATDVEATVTGATVALPVIANTLDGCCCELGGLVVAKGLTALSTGDASIIIEWDSNLP